MKIIKLKKTGKNKYKVIFDSTEVILYEDIILKYDLLLKQDIDMYKLDEMMEDNKYYEAYYLAINYIDIKMRNKIEIEKYLRKKEFSSEIIEFVIGKLLELDLLNDKKYLEAYVNDRVNLSNDGPFKIKRELLEYGYDEELINEKLNRIDYSVWRSKIHHLIEKKQKSLKNNSHFMLINKLTNYLFDLGYDTDLIEEELTKIEYDNSGLLKDYEKAVIKYDNNYKKIKTFLGRKGYTLEEINSLVKQ